MLLTAENWAPDTACENGTWLPEVRSSADWFHNVLVGIERGSWGWTVTIILEGLSLFIFPIQITKGERINKETGELTASGELFVSEPKAGSCKSCQLPQELSDQLKELGIHACSSPKHTRDHVPLEQREELLDKLLPLYIQVMQTTHLFNCKQMVRRAEHNKLPPRPLSSSKKKREGLTWRSLSTVKLFKWKHNHQEIFFIRNGIQSWVTVLIVTASRKSSLPEDKPMRKLKRRVSAVICLTLADAIAVPWTSVDTNHPAVTWKKKRKSLESWTPGFALTHFTLAPLATRCACWPDDRICSDKIITFYCVCVCVSKIRSESLPRASFRNCDTTEMW